MAVAERSSEPVRGVLSGLSGQAKQYRYHVLHLLLTRGARSHD